MISVVQFRTVSYAEGLRLQQQLIELRKAGEIGDVLLLLEHSPVITLGRNAKAANVLASTEVLAGRGVEVFECDRGGDVTFHGPGQLVGYPIFDLRGFEKSSQFSVPSSQENQPGSLQLSVGRRTLGAVDYVRRLEEVLIRACADFGISTGRVKGLTGVWTAHEPETKIAAIGVHISRSVTSHGFALNSMQRELGREVDLNDVAQAVSRNFGSVFGRQMLWAETLDALLGNSVGVPMKAPEELRRLRGEEDVFLA
jgi:lipoyl(octanoyl) transferase